MKWRNRAELSIAQGALTNSKRPSVFVDGVYPTHASHGRGALLWADGKPYIDYVCGLGTNLLGYANSSVHNAIGAQFAKGATLSLSSEMEVELAEKLKGLFLFADLWKFGKNGTDAANAAIRIARAYHGVRYENENLYELQGSPAARGIPQEPVEDGWLEEQLQGLCEGVSQNAESHRDASQSSAGICENGKGAGDRKAARPKKRTALTGNGPASDILACEAGNQKRHLDKAALRSLWQQSASASPRLQQTTGRSMAVSPTSHGNTPRVLILSEGYHGTGGEFIGLTPPHCGIVRDPYTLPLAGNWDLIKKAAAVIIEPVVLDYSQERREWLKALREECTKHGTVLIYDEIITGFRFPGYAVAKATGIFPDMILLGKALGGGLPLSAIGGRKEIMNCGEYFVSGTFFGETVSLAACRALIDVVHKDGSKFNMTDLWSAGDHFIYKFNELHPDLKIVGYPTRGAFQGDPMVKALLWQEACRAGILFGPSWFFNFPLMEYTDTVIPICRDIFNRIKTGSVRLDGKMPQATFAQKQRE
jgi:4-aminobutyrate aminotransferase-like enzyme